MNKRNPTMLNVSALQARLEQVADRARARASGDSQGTKTTAAALKGGGSRVRGVYHPG
jgi:hypothetical protein